jgi:hypothetical protein
MTHPARAIDTLLSTTPSSDEVIAIESPEE